MMFMQQHGGCFLRKSRQKNGAPKVVGEIACMDPMTFSFIEEENILKTEAFSSP